MSATVGASARSVMEFFTVRLAKAGFENAAQEATWLVSREIGLLPLELSLREGALDQRAVARLEAQAARRCAGEPLQYILGEAPFFGATFAVEPGVFIPRPETETVVAVFLERLRATGGKKGPAPFFAKRGQAPPLPPLRVVDLGTGSGCIAVTLARELPACLVVAVELSWTTLSVARRNVLAHGMAARVACVQGDWLQPLRGVVDGIISNPPYVPSRQVDGLPRDVRHEPRLSLDGGPDGLDPARRLLRQASERLAPQGVLVLECGEDHAGQLLDEVRRLPWAASAELIIDLTQRPRGVVATRR